MSDADWEFTAEDFQDGDVLTSVKQSRQVADIANSVHEDRCPYTQLRAQLDEAKEFAKFIFERENFMFAECSLAEEIVNKARAFLEKLK